MFNPPFEVAITIAFAAVGVILGIAWVVWHLIQRRRGG